METISISKRRIAAKSTDTVTTHPGMAVTLWVERGRVEVLSALDGPVIARLESPGSAPMSPGAVHLRNKGTTAAIVFVAIGRLEQKLDALGDAPATTQVPKRFNVFCDTGTHGLLNPSPLSHGGAVSLQNQHVTANAACGTRTRIREA